MTLYKNLSLNKKRLYRRAWELGLTEWHWTAAQCLLAVNGFENAMDYLDKCGKKQNKQQPLPF